MGGTSEYSKQLCADTLCLAPICALIKGGFGISADKTYGNQPDNPNQWFRFFLPIFIHAGIIHLFLLLGCQLHLGCSIEEQVMSMPALL